MEAEQKKSSFRDNLKELLVFIVSLLIILFLCFLFVYFIEYFSLLSLLSEGSIQFIKAIVQDFQIQFRDTVGPGLIVGALVVFANKHSYEKPSIRRNLRGFSMLFVLILCICFSRLYLS